MKKRVFSMLLALSVLSTSFVGAFSATASAEGEKAEQYKGFGYEHEIKNSTPLYMIDFEESDSEEGLSVKYRTGTELSYGEDRTGGTALQTTGDTSFYLPLPEPMKTGQYLLSFDYKQNINSASYMYMRWNWNNGINTYFSVKDGKIGSVSNWSYVGNDYTPDEWVHVNLFLDFDRDTMDMYFNNEFYTQRTGMVDLTEDIIMTCSSEKGLVRSYDNFALFKFTNEFRLESRALGLDMPNEFSDDVDIEIGSKYSGNIFTEFSDVEMDITLTNKSSEPVEYDITYRVEDYCHQLVEEKTVTGCSLTGEETYVHKFQPNVDRYDIYTLFVTVNTKFEGAKPVLMDREFSVVHTPTLGYKNPIFGTCTHPGRDRTDWREIERQFNISGLGYTRTDGNWGAFEPAVGQYKQGPAFEAEASAWASDKSPNFYADRAAEGTKNILIFNPTNNLYTGLATGPSTYEQIAASPVALAALEKAGEALASMYKGRVHVIELGNELNFQRVEVMSPEAYAKICQAAYKGIKKGNPDCVVLTHGHSRSAGDLIYRYLIEAKNNGGGKPFDGVAIHPYIGQGYIEQTQWEDNVLQATRAIERAGYTRDDFEVWVTEGNSNTHKQYHTNVQHAASLIRQYTIIQGYNIVDKYMMYQLQVAETNMTDGEHWFGCLQGRTTKNKNAARKTYLAICNWNALTENAEVVNKQRFDDDNTVFVQFKKPNGNYLTVMYTTSMCKDMTINAGAATGTIYDLWGNPTEVASADGKYTFTLTDLPVFFETSGSGFEISEENDIVKNRESIELAKDGVDSFEVTVPKNAALEFNAPENLEISQVRSGNTVTVTVKASELPILEDHPALGTKAGEYTEHVMSDGSVVYTDHIDTYVVENGVVTDMIYLPVTYAYQGADVRMELKPYDNTNTTYWQGVVYVTNNRSTPISGTVKIESPKGVTPMEIKDLAAGQKTKVIFNIPKDAMQGSTKFYGTFTISDGEAIEFWMGDTPRSRHYASPGGGLAVATMEKVKGETTVIDGVINADEWEAFKLMDFDKSAVSYGNQGNIIDGLVERSSNFGAEADYGGKEDFSGTVYAKWDENYLYAAAIVYDDVHWQKQDVRSFYYDDLFYIVGKETNTQRHDSRIDIALSDYHQHEAFDESEKHGMIWCNYTPTIEGYNANTLHDKGMGDEVYITRKDTVTIYEVKLSWQNIWTQESVDRRQGYLAFNFRDYDGDRDKTNSWSRWFVLTDTKNN